MFFISNILVVFRVSHIYISSKLWFFKNWSLKKVKHLKILRLETYNPISDSALNYIKIKSNRLIIFMLLNMFTLCPLN